MDTKLENKTLTRKVNKSREVIREAVEKFGAERIAVSWLGDMGSVFLLHLIKQEYGDFPLPVVHYDYSVKYEKAHALRDQLAGKLNLNLIIRLMEPGGEGGKSGENQIHYREMEEYGWQALMVPLINEGESTEGKHDFFFKSDIFSHTFVKPILHFKEKDIQAYLEMHGLSGLDFPQKEYNPQAPTFCEEEQTDTEDLDPDEEVKRRLRDLGYI